MYTFYKTPFDKIVDSILTSSVESTNNEDIIKKERLQEDAIQHVICKEMYANEQEFRNHSEIDYDMESQISEKSDNDETPEQVAEKIDNAEAQSEDNEDETKEQGAKRVHSVSSLQPRHHCDICGKAFSHKRSINTHKKIVHEGIKRFQCEHCEKKFISKRDVDVHIKAVHALIKDFQCQHCYQTFSQKPHLTSHIKAVHLKIKDVQCQHCEKMFSQKNHLAKHIKAVHDN